MRRQGFRSRFFFVLHITEEIHTLCSIRLSVDSLDVRRIADVKKCETNSLFILLPLPRVLRPIRLKFINEINHVIFPNVHKDRIEGTVYRKTPSAFLYHRTG